MYFEFNSSFIGYIIYPLPSSGSWVFQSRPDLTDPGSRLGLGYVDYSVTLIAARYIIALALR